MNSRLAVNNYFQTPHFAKPFIIPPTLLYTSKTCEAKPQNIICPNRTLTQLLQTHIKITRCTARSNKGARGRSHSHCPLLRSPLPPFTPFTSPSLPEASARVVSADSYNSEQLMQGQLLFFPSPPFCSPNCSPFNSSLPCLHSSPLYFPLPSLYPVILLCTFSSGGYKGRSCQRERACVISGCT